MILVVNGPLGVGKTRTAGALRHRFARVAPLGECRRTVVFLAPASAPGVNPNRRKRPQRQLAAVARSSARPGCLRFGVTQTVTQNPAE